MLGTFNKLFERRRETNEWKSAFEMTASGGDPQTLAAFLKNNPHWSEQTAKRAIHKARTYDTLTAVRVLTALSWARMNEAIDVLKEIQSETSRYPTGDYYVPWEKIDVSDINPLADLLKGAGEVDLIDWLWRRLKEDQITALLPHFSDPDFLAKIDSYIEAKLPLKPIGPRVVDFLWSKEATSEELARAIAIAERMLDKNQASGALAILHNIALLRSEAIPRDIVNRINNRLPSLPTSLDLVRAASVLRWLPDAAYQVNLKQAWLAVIEDIRNVERESQSQPHSPYAGAAAGIIALALGSCAAQDPKYIERRPAEKERKQHTGLIEKRKNLFEQRSRLAQELMDAKAAGRELNQNKAEQIMSLDKQIEDLEEEVDASLARVLSTDEVLLRVLSDSQGYPIEIRQAAAWGLKRLRASAHLNSETATRIDDALRAALLGISREEIKEQLEAIFPKSDESDTVPSNDAEPIELPEENRAEVLQLLITAVQSRDAFRLHDQLLDMQLNETTVETLLRRVESISRTARSGQFGERIVRVLKGQCAQEALASLRDGLSWMVEFYEDDNSGTLEQSLATQFERLPSILEQLQQNIPGFLTFLERYPLRLMTLENHRRMIGQFRSTPVDINIWTRYLPPRWQRGMAPGEAGKVLARYLTLDDRSLPNAMGIYYKLFRHPLLALPVIYHEFMHYGGPKGDPDNGIANESEVLLREICFARGLFARMATQNADPLRFEYEVVTIAQECSVPGLLSQLLFDVHDDYSLYSLVSEIKSVYGEGMREESAQERASAAVERYNLILWLTNQTDITKQNWCPEVEWPPLDGSLAKLYRDILVTTYTRDHNLAAAQRDAVLAERQNQVWAEQWRSYEKATGALVVLRAKAMFDIMFVVNRFVGVRRN